MIHFWVTLRQKDRKFSFPVTGELLAGFGFDRGFQGRLSSISQGSNSVEMSKIVLMI